VLHFFLFVSGMECIVVITHQGQYMLKIYNFTAMYI